MMRCIRTDLGEVYDVVNFYKHHGWAQSLARSMRFERVTLFVICSPACLDLCDVDFS